jgi:hypothetical protein
MLSFLLFPLCVYLLERARKAGGKSPYLLLPLFVLWGNIHPGFLLGVAAVWIYFIAGLIRIALGRASFKDLKATAAIALLTALAFAVMPSALKSLPGLILSFIHPSPYMETIQEYLSPLSAALELGEYYPAYWLALLLTAYALISGGKKMPLEHILMLVFFGLLPFKGLRFMPYFTMLSPLIALGTARKDWEESRFLFFGFIGVLVLWLVFVPVRPAPGLSPEFPEKAVGFLKKAGPRGKVFNYHGWAGYLSWAFPESRLFIPVSGSLQDVDEAYDKILRAEGAMTFAGPEWRALLEAYGLDVILIPGASPVTGRMYPLVDALQSETDWYLIYSDESANILLRATPANRETISLNSLPKANIYLQVMAQTERYLKDDPKKPGLKETLQTAKERLQPKKTF